MMRKKDSFDVVVVSDLLAGFPHGYATQSYMRLVSNGLVLAGATVYIPILFWSNRVFEADIPVTGVIDGIRYEYLSGTVSGNFAFARRQYLKVRTYLMFFFRMVQLSVQGRIDVLVYQPWTFKFIGIIKGLCCIFRIPMVIHLLEWPAAWQGLSDLERKDYKKKYDKAIRYSDGSIVISKYLEEKCAEVTSRSKKVKSCFRLPILMDENSWKGVSPIERDRPYLLYCAALDSYIEDAFFILDAFSRANIAEYDLVMVGHASDETLQALRRHSISLGMGDRIVIVSKYLPEKILLGYYAGAAALLAPLRDDDQSKARFPSKIAGYLYSGRPIVSSRVGEVAEYLEDEVSAYLAKPNCIDDFSDKIKSAVNDLKENKVGLAGKSLALSEFSVVSQGKRLLSFLQDMKSKSTYASQP